MGAASGSATFLSLGRTAEAILLSGVLAKDAPLFHLLQVPNAVRPAAHVPAAHVGRR